MIKKGRGRPRQYPIVPDKGTPEQQLKRLALVDGGNPVMSTTPLDILLERQMIHEDHHRAGMTWWMTFMRIYGKVYPESNTGKLMTPIRGRGLISKVGKKSVDTWNLYKDINQHLKENLSVKCSSCLRDIVLFQWYPPYLLHNEMLVEDNKHKKMVRFGFEKLSDFFNTKKKRR